MDTMQKYKDNKYRRVIYLKYNQKVSWEISLQLVFHNYKKEGINYFLPYLENMQAIVSKVQTSFIAIKKINIICLIRGLACWVTKCFPEVLVQVNGFEKTEPEWVHRDTKGRTQETKSKNMNSLESQTL